MSQTMGFDFEQQHKKIKNAALSAIKSTFPIDGIRHKLELERAWVEESLGVYDISEQKKTKFSNGSWAEPIYTSLRLVDKESGKTIDTVKKFKLFNLPKQTSRFSYIIDGNEYQPINQLRLKSGVYSRIKANNQLESQFNLARGMNFKIILNQETGLFYINISTSNIKLLPILIDLGMSPSDIKSVWGDDLFDTNHKASRGVMGTEIFKLYNKLTRKDTTSREEAIAEVLTYFNDRTELSKEVTKLNIGKSYGKVNANLLLDTSKRLLGIAKKTEEPDDRDSLISKEIHSIEDFISERLVKNADTIARSIKRNIDKKTKIREIISLDTFNQPIKTLFTSTSLASTTEQINPLDMISNQWKATIMGEGGITNIQQISNSARAVHPTHLGFLDPFQTVEGPNIGATLQLSLSSAKVGKELKTFVYDLKDGSGKDPKQVSPKEFFDNYVAFPDEYVLRGGKRVPQNKDKITAMYKGEIVEVKPSKIKFVIASEKGILGMPSNLIPFVNSDNGNRAMMAAKMLPQALSLKAREEPLVQTSMGTKETFHSGIAKHFDTPSEIAGVIDSIEPGEIMIKDKNGDLWSHQTYDNFPLNQKSFMHDKAVVAVGQKVKKGQRLTENNYTKNGKLALGINLRAAYIPMKGYSFEDSIVLSESASQKLTSEHMYKKSVRIAANTIVSLKRFQAYYPGIVTSEMASKLGADGVIKKGKKVEKGDVIIAALVESEVSKEDSILAKISRSLVKPYKDKSVKWEYDFQGIVTDVVKDKKRVDVYIKSEERAVIGDKLSGVHGNKGTIGLILPDNEMPHNKAGEPVDLLLNPHGLVSRMNPGQMLETVAAKMAEKLKTIYVVDNFEDKNYYNKVMGDAKKAGVKGTTKLFDPVTGTELGDIFSGKQYILKLNHPTRKKFSARSYGEGYSAELAPSRGGSTSGQSIDPLTVNSLLAHGSRAILRETHSIKSEKNDEYWRALQMGLPIPPPKNTFIYDKFIGYLKGTGIDVVKNGDRLQLLPLTDKDILANSNGEIKDITIVRGKNLKEEKNGLFDPKITGGLQGLHSAHIKLSEPIPNPVFENAIKAVTGLKKEQYEGIVNGVLFVGKDGSITDDYKKGSTGGTAINQMLSKIKVAKRIKELNKHIPKAKKAELNKLNKELRYLTALERMDRKPTDYVLKNIPVVPPVFRPIYTLPDGNTTVSDLNRLYKDVKSESDQLKNSLIPEYDKKNLRTDMYKSVKALFGLGQSLTKPDLKGTLAEIRGEKPKTGLFQSKIVKRRQDLSGRSVITPGPNLGVDECGIPEPMAWKLYKPFVVKRLVQSGYTPLEAQVKIEERDDIAKSALITEMGERNVMLNRAPSLHKFSIMGFKPKLISGKAIRLPNLVCKSYGADFDGNFQQTSTLITKIKNSNKIIEDYNYPENYLEERKMSAKFKTVVPMISNDEELYMFDLEDFPHGEWINARYDDVGRIDLYEAIPGTKILAYDEDNNKVEWKDVKYYSVHKSPEVEIVNLKSGRQIITDDHPRAVYGVNSGYLELVRNTPTKALENKMLVPRMVRFDIDNIAVSEIEAINVSDRKGILRLKEKIELNHEFGYIVGILAAEGWVDDADVINMAGITKEIIDKYTKCLESIFNGRSPVVHQIESKTSMGKSFKNRFGSVNFAKFIKPLIGHMARNKHLPSWFLRTPRNFRIGLFAGLMDGDGSISVSRAKGKNPQLMSNYFSTSLRLSREVKLLAESLGIRGKITTTKTPLDRPAWCLSFSNYDIKNRWKGNGLAHPDKLRKLASIEVNESGSLARHDIVPISTELALQLREKFGSYIKLSREDKTICAVLSKSKKSGYLSRFTANKILSSLGVDAVSECSDGPQWMKIVNNDNITWDLVVNIDKTKIKETGYDLTIPGYETFTTADGLILSNTMAVHVPVTEEGKREAKLMMPSNHLLNPGSKALTLAPSQESLIGLYLLTKEGKKTTKKYKDLIDARTAVRKGKILATDRVTIDGVKTTTGRYLVNEILPKDIRNYNVQIDKKVITGMLKSVVDRYKNKYNTIVNALHKLGNDHAYHAGFTVTMEDLKPVSARRDQILRSADKSLARFKETNKPTKAQLDRKSVEIYTKATEEMKQALAEVLRERENSLYQMATSGARGNLGQVRQIVMAPMLLVNTDGKTIPRPIKKSYVEGLSTAEMWIASYGARKGAVDKSRETSGPGELSKMLASSAMSNVISINDCGTHNGILVNVNDKDIFDRYAAADVVGIVKYNEIVTPSVVEKAKRKKTTQLPVRSPLKCEALEGTCAMCSGLDENGENYDIGTNIGIIAAQTLSEPAVQLVMKSTSGLISTADGIYPMSVFFDRSTNKIELEECDNANPVCNAIDKNGETETTITQRHKPHDDMYLVTTRSGACILAQGNHPMWVYDEQLRQGFSNRFTKLIGESEYSCTAAFPRSFTHKSTKKETIKTPRELSREDAIWVDYRPLKGGNVTPDVDPYVAGYFAAEGCFRVGNGTKKYDGIKVATIFSCHTNSAWFEKDVLGSILKVKHSVGQQAYTIYGLDYAKKLSMIVGYSSDHHRAHNKVLKVDIASLDPKWAQEFLEGYIDGDGCVFDRGNTTVAKTTSTSFELTCQIVAICHKLGLHCSVGTSDGAPCRKDVRTAFDVSIRFTKEYKPINSIKLVNIKPMQHKFGAICGYDPVQMVKKLNNWDGYVYDVKTETEGYMAGFIRNHNSFHTGGAAGEGSKIIGAFDRLKQIVEMPQNLVNKATLSSMTGKISDVKESSVGGFDVFVGNTKHHVRAGYDLKVKTGDQVKMGDQLSSGVIKPQELLEYKGMDAVQSYLKNELYDLYSDDGPIRKSIIEQMIRAITSLTQIDDPLDTNYIAGDIVPIRKIEALNKGAAKNSKILHTPILKGVNMLPTALSSYEDADWAGRMGYTHLLKTMSEGASQGWSTDIHGYHPIPGLMYASEFGKSEKGKY